MTNNYTGIDLYDGIEAVRRVPGMYVGSTNKISDNHSPKALIQLLQEVLSNSLDEYVAGYGDEIHVLASSRVITVVLVSLVCTELD